MMRSRLQTEQRILDAVGSLLLEQGYTAVGINAIARQAGCDKVLIYRYFGGFDELLRAFAETTALWWEVDEIMPESAADCAAIALPEYLQTLLNRYVEALEARPLALEIMAWEMSDQNSLTTALARSRSERGMELVKRIRGYYQQPKAAEYRHRWNSGRLRRRHQLPDHPHPQPVAAIQDRGMVAPTADHRQAATGLCRLKYCAWQRSTLPHCASC
jgi:AcrR family transcriptional regulator